MENKGNQGFVPLKPSDDVDQVDDVDDMLNGFLDELGDDFDVSNLPVPGGAPVAKPGA